MKPLRTPLRRSSSCWHTSATRISLLSSTGRSLPGGYSSATAQVMTMSEPSLPGSSSNVELNLHQRSACFGGSLSLMCPGGAAIVARPKLQCHVQAIPEVACSSHLHVLVVSNAPITHVSSSCTGISWHLQTPPVPYTAMHLLSANALCLSLRVH